MPNHVENYIYLKGDQLEIDKVLEEIKSDEHGVGSIDFNKIVPMPESLDIEVGSSTDRGLEKYDEFVTIYTIENGITGLDILNIPTEIEDAYRKRDREITDKEWKLGKAAFQNRIKYGHGTWYEWCIDNWGTTCNSYGYDWGIEPKYMADDNTIRFNTAWSAPLPIVAELSNKYPDIEFTIEWADETIGENCGKKVYMEGEVIEEYFPETKKEAIEYACKVHCYDSPNDIGLYLNASGTGYVYVLSGKYQLTVFDGNFALFSNDNLFEEDIPNGMYCYDLRKKEDGSGFATIEPIVWYNFGGTLITKVPIEFGEDRCISLKNKSTLVFLPKKDACFKDLMNDNIEENLEELEQKL